jgi:hypothetical protein
VQLHTDFDRAPWIKMPVAELMKFKPGYVCKTPSWWAVTEDNCVLFWRTLGSPQCNVDRRIVEHIRPGMRVEFITQAFVPPQPC